MSTRLRVNDTVTVPETGEPSNPGTANYRDLITAAAVNNNSYGTMPTADANGERRFGNLAANPNKELSFWSKRLASEVTISGSVTFTTYVLQAASPNFMTGRLRARLYKITSGGSAVESLILSADAAADLSAASAQYVFSGTPSQAVTLGRGERLILRISVTPHITTGFGTGIASCRIQSFSSDSLSTYMDVTESLTFLENYVALWLRRTNTIGIGNFFDMLTTQGALAATTGVVNTTAGGTEIQWTRTAGGTVLEWVSPRVKEPFALADITYVQGQINAFESAGQANCAVRMKIFHRAPDGTETLVLTFSQNEELGTGASGSVNFLALLIRTLNQAMSFREDDRLVFRLYIIPFGGTMDAGRTCTATYDLNAPTGVGAAHLKIYGAFTFKAESDPAASSSIPGGLTMGGIGN